MASPTWSIFLVLGPQPKITQLKSSREKDQIYLSHVHHRGVYAESIFSSPADTDIWVVEQSREAFCGGLINLRQAEIRRSLEDFRKICPQRVNSNIVLIQDWNDMLIRAVVGTLSHDVRLNTDRFLQSRWQDALWFIHVTPRLHSTLPAYSSRCYEAHLFFPLEYLLMLLCVPVTRCGI